MAESLCEFNNEVTTFAPDFRHIYLNLKYVAANVKLENLLLIKN